LLELTDESVTEPLGTSVGCLRADRRLRFAWRRELLAANCRYHERDQRLSGRSTAVMQ